MPNLYVDHVNGDNNSTIYIHDAELRNTLGQANGIATLDNTGKLPTSQLPNSVNNKLEASTLASENETEATTTATKAHAKDSKFYLAATGEYCMAKTAIAIGDTLVKDTNYQVISINGFLTSLESYLILAGQILDTKADKVTNATNGNLAGLNGSGNLTDSGWNGAKDTTSISGNPISISGLKANQLAVNPIITLEPIQDLHGQSKPYPAGGGKNKLNMPDKTISGADWVFNKSECVLSAGTYIFSWTVNLSTSNSCEFQVYDSTGNTIIADVTSNIQTPIQFTITQTAGYCRFYAATGGTFSKFMIRLSTESVDYAPYENICPISGYDKVEALSCGANLCPAFDTHTAINGAGQKYTYDPSSLSKTPIKLFKGVTYYSYIKYSPFTVTPSPYVHKFAANGSYIGYNTIPSNGTVTFDDNVAYIYIQLNKNGTITEDVSTIQYNFYLSDTSINGHYYPYDKATSISESLGQTVYGGTLDVRTGVLTVDMAIADMGDLNWSYSVSADFFYTSLSGMKNASKLVCSQYENLLPSSAQTKDATIGVTSAGQIRCINRAYGTDAAAFKAAMVGSQMVYELATPFTIQLTPREISLLKDYAYLSTNGTNIALDYHNGELASLADVAQVGETVNALGDRLKNVDVKVYYSGSNENWKIYRIGRIRILTAWNCPVGKMLTYVDDIDKPIEVYDSAMILIDSRMARFRIQADGGIGCQYIYSYGGSAASYTTSSTEKVFTSFAYVAKE